MNEMRELIIAWLVGALSGFFVSIPVGPINIAIVNEGVIKGFWFGFWIGLGAVIMEVIYCAVAFAGFSGLFASELIRAVLALTSFLMMIFLGVKYLLVRSLPATTKTIEKFEHRLHPHTAFFKGFIRVAGNPGVLLFWVTLSTVFIAHDWMDNTWQSKFSCVLGMGIGSFAWFVLLSFGVSLGHGKVSTQSLVRLSHLSGLFLLAAAIFIGGQLVKQLYGSAELRSKVKALEKQIQKPFQR